MPQCMLDNLSDAVVAAIADPANASKFNAIASFGVERVNALEFDASKFKTPKVLVYGADERRDPISRIATQREWDIHIGILQGVKDERDATIAPLKLLVEQIADFWEFRDPAVDGADWKALDLVPVITELLKEGSFVGVVQVTFTGEVATS